MISPKTALRIALPTLLIVGVTPVAALETAPALISVDEDESRAKALEIINRHIEAIGGADAIRAHTSVTQTGSMAIPAAGIEGTLTVMNRAPNLFSVNIEVPDMGSMATGYNGEIGWSSNPIEGATKFEGEQLRDIQIQADYINVLNTERHYEEISYDGVRAFAGQQANVVKLVDSDAKETLQLYSVESGLLIGVLATQSTTMGDVEVSSELSEYKAFGDLKFATRTIQLAGVQAFEILVKNVSYDEISEEAFALPPAIKALTEAPEPATAP